MTDNQKAIHLLDDWFAESDDLDDEFWEEYEQDVDRFFDIKQE